MSKKPDKNARIKSSGRRVTQRDIAKKAGVSHVAVSHALRNNPQVSAKTRERILKIAAEMDYKPDPMLSALSQYRLANRERPVQAAMAWLNAWDQPEKLRSYHEFELYWKGASRTAGNLGFNLEEFRLKNLPQHRLEQILRTRNIRGVLIPPDRTTSVHWDTFDWSQFSTVRLGRSPKKPQFHFVSSAQTQNSIMAFNRIRERGYKRIGFVGIVTDSETFGAGFFWAQQQVPKRQQLPELLMPERYIEKGWEKPLSSWLDKNKPDAIYTRISELPDMLNKLGYRIPDDVALATTSVIDTPIDAGIDQNSEEIGRAAVLTLASLINDSERGVPGILHEHLIEGKWVDGSMLPACAGQTGMPTPYAH